jgi:hypothetical protein
MTKVFSIIAVAFLATTFVACGPSAEEKAKMEEMAKAKADSLKADSLAIVESISNALTDSIATVETATTAAAPAAEAEVKH